MESRGRNKWLMIRNERYTRGDGEIEEEIDVFKRIEGKRENN